MTSATAPAHLGPAGDIPPGAARRALDVTVATLGLLLSLPLLLVLAALVRCTGRPVLFRQQRVGQGARLFVIYKLRTMRAGAGPLVAHDDDERVTVIGRFLRRTSLDELPQLWNVLRGDMTLVGPRPEAVGLAERYPPSCRWVFAHRPGITGPVQLEMRDNDTMRDLPATDAEEHYLVQLVPQRTALDASYLRDPSMLATLGYLWRTLRHLVGHPT